MTASLILIDTVYLVFLIGFLVFSGVALFHLSEYGYVGDFCRTMIVIYAAVAASLMLATVIALITLG